MEMTRDFEMYSKWSEEDEVRDIFKQFAEDEGLHASQLRTILDRYQDKRAEE
jgi:rubrerythrin